MTDSITTCPIWGDDSEAEGERQSEQGLMTVKFSARAGGAYEITEEVSLSVQELSNSQKARLTTILINQRNQGDRRPKVTTEIVEYAKRKRPIPIYERAERLLQYFVENTPIIGSSLKIGYHDQFQWCALAWSESVEITEVFSLDTYLEGRGWVQLNGNEIKVQVDGYSRVADLATNVDSSQAFVAMWFPCQNERPL